MLLSEKLSTALAFVMLAGPTFPTSTASVVVCHCSDAKTLSLSHLIGFWWEMFCMFVSHQVRLDAVSYQDTM